MHLFHGSGDTLRNFDEHQGHDFDYGWISQYHPVSQTGHYEYDEHLRPWLDITNNFQNFQPTPNQSHFFYPSSSMPSANFFDVHQSNILPDGKQIRLTGSDQQSHNSFKDYNFASEIPSITTGFQPPSKGFLEKNQSQNLLSERESHQMDPLQLKKSFESTDYLPSAKDMIYKEIHQPHKFQSGGSYNSGYLPTNLNNFKHDVFNVANTGLNENYFQNGLQSDQPLDLDSANMFLNCECNDPSEKSSARICNSDTDATERVKKVKGVYHKQLGFLATSNIGSKNLFKKRKENLVNPVMNKVIFNEREGTKMTSNLEDFSSQQKFENLKNSSHQDKIIKSSNYKIILKSKEGKNDHEKKSKPSPRTIGFTTPLISKTFLPDFPNIGTIRYKIELKTIIDNLDKDPKSLNDQTKNELMNLLSEPNHSYTGIYSKKLKINTLGTNKYDSSLVKTVFLDKNNQKFKAEDKSNNIENSNLINTELDCIRKLFFVDFYLGYYDELKTIDNFVGYIKENLSNFSEWKIAFESLMDWNIIPKSSKKIEEIGMNEENIIKFWTSYRRYFSPPGLAKIRYQLFKYDSTFYEYWLISGKRYLKSLRLSDTVDKAHENFNIMFYNNFYEKVASIKQYNWVKSAVNSIILICYQIILLYRIFTPFNEQIIEELNHNLKILINDTEQVWIEVLKHYKILHNVTKSDSNCLLKSEVLSKVFNTKGRANLQYITSQINKEITTAWLTNYCKHSFKFLNHKETNGNPIYFKDFLDDCYIIDFIEQNPSS
ncbi:hypothetical protein BY996DRAFT_6409572 [Phakopsora pachyrhizi]|nr:hypothetical protein BY996DRAFT_6409572 [Phakopsora pachyrhizi]